MSVMEPYNTSKHVYYRQQGVLRHTTRLKWIISTTMGGGIMIRDPMRTAIFLPPTEVDDIWEDDFHLPVPEKKKDVFAPDNQVTWYTEEDALSHILRTTKWM